ncbi:MAG TPA: sulfurtransferase complex subunit TusC [Pseudomonadales bacterium]
MEAKHILFLLRQPPYATSHALEALEAVLVAGVFDQVVSVLFSGDGVWQLVDGQDGAPLGQRTVAKVAQALPQYDVTNLYVCARSLEQRGLDVGDLALPVQVLDAVEQRTLIAAQHAVVND